MYCFRKGVLPRQSRGTQTTEEDQIKQWRVKPEQSELLELMKYAEEVGLGNYQHEYMANNLDVIMRGMKQFVASNYPSTYNSVYARGGGDASYYALCLAGLESTQFYTKFLATKNLTDNQMAKLRNDFATTEKPNCYE